MKRVNVSKMKINILQENSGVNRYNKTIFILKKKKILFEIFIYKFFV